MSDGAMYSSSRSLYVNELPKSFAFCGLAQLRVAEHSNRHVAATLGSGVVDGTV